MKKMKSEPNLNDKLVEGITLSKSKPRSQSLGDPLGMHRDEGERPGKGRTLAYHNSVLES